MKDNPSETAVVVTNISVKLELSRKLFSIPTPCVSYNIFFIFFEAVSIWGELLVSYNSFGNDF